MDDFDGVDELDDDWFYESVTRYNMLQMFYLQNIPEHVVQVDDVMLCIANRSQKYGTRELLALKLPTKLTLPSENEGRSKDNDFKILSGIFIEKPIFRMEALIGGKKIITAQESRKGLQVYSFSDGADLNQEEQTINAVSWETPNFAVNQHGKRIICSRCNHEALIVFDLDAETRIKENPNPFHEDHASRFGIDHNEICTDNNVKCEMLVEDQVAVLDSNKGRVCVIDLRTERAHSKFAIAANENSSEFWTLSRCDYNTSPGYFGILSNGGSFVLYDLRNPKEYIKNDGFRGATVNSDRVKLKVADGRRFSVSGCDSNVYVYNILQNSFELAFTHDGHSQKDRNHGDVNGLVNDHIWLPGIGNNFLVSICNNKSLNCWEYNELVV